MKYTDADIEKALKCCANKKRCHDCPFCRTSREPCYITLAREAASLLARRDAEIERLKELLNGWKTEAYKVADEKDELYFNAVERVKTAKAEAIKEFAERAGVMITEVYNKHIFGENDLEAEEKDAIINFSDDITGGLDDLEKEMTEAPT